MNSTTKSCSTYLSQNRPQFLQTVSRMLWPPEAEGLLVVEEVLLVPPSRQRVFTGWRHSMQIGMVAAERGLSWHFKGCV